MPDYSSSQADVSFFQAHCQGGKSQIASFGLDIKNEGGTRGGVGLTKSARQQYGTHDDSVTVAQSKTNEGGRTMQRTVERITALGLSIILTLALLACSREYQPPPPAKVQVVAEVVASVDVPVLLEFVGVTESSRSVEVRARVEGHLQRKTFTEGTLIREGTPLFQIDTKPFAVAVESTAAAVREREGALLNAQWVLERLRQLLQENAASRKDVDDAASAEKSAIATLAAARAELLRAQASLAAASISAPLTGLVGKAAVSEGSYINPAVNGLLTTVSQVDPIWANFSVSESEWERFFEDIKVGRIKMSNRDGFDVEMLLASGRPVTAKGKVNFASPALDPQTGTFSIRAAFANADMSVRPGQTVRIRLMGAIRPQAIALPQSAILQGQSGKYVYVVTAGAKVEARPVTVGEWSGDRWIIRNGLKVGEKVVVSGMARLEPGAEVTEVAAGAQTLK